MLKCKVCYGGKVFLAPNLKASGYSAPKDYICPICNTFHSSNGEIFKEKKDTINKPVESFDTITIYK